MTYEPLMWSDGTEVPASVLRGATSMILDDGITSMTDLVVSPRAEGANMSVDVAPGRAVVDGYIAQRSTKLNLGIGAPPPSGQVRIDSVQVRLDLPEWDIRVVAGTPTQSGSPPGVPNGALELAQVRVASGITSITGGDITDQRPWAIKPDPALFGGAAVTFPQVFVSQAGITAATATITPARVGGTAILRASAYCTLGAAGQGQSVVARVRVDISRNGGAAWSTGPWITGTCANFLNPDSIAAGHQLTTEIQGPVHARIRAERLSGVDARLEGGLSLVMMPG